MTATTKKASGEDFTAGLIFIALGALLTVLSSASAIGVAPRLGPAAFSNVLASLFAVAGILSILRGALADKASPGALRTESLQPFIVLLAMTVGVLPTWLFGASPRLVFASALLCGAMAALGLGLRTTAGVLAPILLWALVLDPLVLVLSSGILVIVSVAPPQSRWRDILVAAAALGVAAWVVLGIGLGLRVSLMPN